MVSVLFLLFTKEADEVLQKEPTGFFFFLMIMKNKIFRVCWTLEKVVDVRPT